MQRVSDVLLKAWPLYPRHIHPGPFKDVMPQHLRLSVLI